MNYWPQTISKTRMNTSIDEKLDKIENMLEDIQEKQRISRFDNLMLLTYPLFFFCFTLLMIAYSNLELLKLIKFFGLPLDSWLFMATMIYLMFLAFPFAIFIRAYISDSLKWRMTASDTLVFYTILWSSFILLLIAGSPLGELAKNYAPMLNLLLLGSFGFSFGRFILNASVSRAENRLLQWLQANFDRRIRMENIKMFKPETARGPTILHKISWLVFFGSYAYVIYLATLSDGLTSTIYHILYLIVLIIIAALDFKGIFSQTIAH